MHCGTYLKSESFSNNQATWVLLLCWKFVILVRLYTVTCYVVSLSRMLIDLTNCRWLAGHTLLSLLFINSHDPTAPPLIGSRFTSRLDPNPASFYTNNLKNYIGGLFEMVPRPRSSCSYLMIITHYVIRWQAAQRSEITYHLFNELILLIRLFNTIKVILSSINKFNFNFQYQF